MAHQPDLGRIVAFNEGAVPFYVDGLRSVLQAGNPAELRKDKKHDIATIAANGLRLRWLQGRESGPDRKGGPPPDFDAAVQHTTIHENELKILEDTAGSEITVPAHSTFVVEQGPYHNGQPIVYTAVEEVKGRPLVRYSFASRVLGSSYAFSKADPEQLYAVGMSFLTFYNDAAQRAQTLSFDTAHPRQISDHQLTLYDLDARLADPISGALYIREWSKYVLDEYGHELHRWANVVARAIAL